MHQHPHSEQHINEEKVTVQNYTKKHKAFVAFLQQKAKIDWKHGDENTALFHQSIKARRLHNHIYNIYDEEGRWMDNSEKVSGAFFGLLQQITR